MLRNGDYGDLLVLLIAGDALGARVQHRLAINQELVMMMAVAQVDLGVPGAVGLAFHGGGVGMPVVEIANQHHPSGVGDGADEIDGLDGLLGGETRHGANVGVMLGHVAVIFVGAAWMFNSLHLM